MNLHDEFFLLCNALNGQGVEYCVVGGLAMAFHATPRFTEDIDILIKRSGLEATKRALAVLGYEPSEFPAKVGSTELELHRYTKSSQDDTMLADILVADDREHCRIIKCATTETQKNGTVRIIRRADLIWMKKNRNALQDKADIEKLTNDTPGKSD